MEKNQTSLSKGLLSVVFHITLERDQRCGYFPLLAFVNSTLSLSVFFGSPAYSEINFYLFFFPHNVHLDFLK